jgi:hypothetical protein
MKTKTDEPKAAPLLAWKVAKVPQIGGVRAAIGGEVKLTQEKADTLNKALPGCLEFQGI